MFKIESKLNLKECFRYNKEKSYDFCFNRINFVIKKDKSLILIQKLCVIK